MPKQFESVGPILRQARLDAELTQQEVADHLKISLWSWNRLENGHLQLNPDWVDTKKRGPHLPAPMRKAVIEYLERRHQAILENLAELKAQIPPTRFPRPTGSSASLAGS